jgi:hypothetical protein
MQPNEPYWQPNQNDTPETAPNPPVDPLQQQGPIVTLTPDPQDADGERIELATDPAAPLPAEPIRWQASEYIHQEKNALWFVGFGVVVLGLMALAILLMQAWTFAVLIAVMAVAVVVYSRRPPRELTYTLSAKGLYIGDRLYDLSEFKSFGVIHDGAEFSVMLIPVKRFLPGVTVYFPEALGEQIVDFLGARLPMQELRLDIIDKVVRKLRL